MVGKRLVWEMPNGSIVVAKSFMEDHVAARRIIEAGPGMAGAIRLPDLEENENLDRTKRHAWRKNPATGKVWIDTNIPDPIILPTLEDRLNLLEEEIVNLKLAKV